MHDSNAAVARDNNVYQLNIFLCFRPIMSSEIEGHITRKYEIKKRLGKGVSLNRIYYVYIVHVYPSVVIYKMLNGV